MWSLGGDSPPNELASALVVTVALVCEDARRQAVAGVPDGERPVAMVLQGDSAFVHLQAFDNSTVWGTSLALPTSNGTRNGTYTINSDGTGTIALLQPNGQPGPMFSFVATDGGAQLLLVQTNNSASRSVSVGTARAQ